MRIGCAGLGFIFRHAHSKAIRILQNRGWPLELTAVCDNRQEAVEEVLRQFPSAAAAANLADLLHGGFDLDVLLILLWPPLSLDFLNQSLDAGIKAILIEKPVAKSSSELLIAVEKAEALCAKVEVAYNRLQYPGLAEFAQQIRLLNPGDSLTASLYRENRQEPHFYEDVSPHAVGMLRRLLGELTLETATFSAPKQKDGLPEALHATLRNEKGVRAELKIQPAYGQLLEHYRAESGDLKLELPFISAEPQSEAGWWRETNGSREFHPARPPMAMEDPATWQMGFLGQMADFMRCASGTAAPNGCNLHEATAILKLTEDILFEARRCRAT